MARKTRSAAASVTHQRGRPGKSIDTCFRVAQSEKLQRRRFSVDADASCNSKAESGNDHGTIRFARRS